MRFTETKLKGSFIIEIEPQIDQRGFFARTYCQEEFKDHGLVELTAQCNKSFNKKKGTIRGVHYQGEPHQEAKLVQCLVGSIYDVIIDLRKSSSTYCQWIDVELSADNNKMLYCPEGFANGFQTLEDSTLIYYHMSHPYSPDHADGIRWDDPEFNIPWPLSEIHMSEKDRAWDHYTKEKP